MDCENLLIPYYCKISSYMKISLTYIRQMSLSRMLYNNALYCYVRLPQQYSMPPVGVSYRTIKLMTHEPRRLIQLPYAILRRHFATRVVNVTQPKLVIYRIWEYRWTTHVNAERGLRGVSIKLSINNE